MGPEVLMGVACNYYCNIIDSYSLLVDGVN